MGVIFLKKKKKNRKGVEYRERKKEAHNISKDHHGRRLAHVDLHTG